MAQIFKPKQKNDLLPSRPIEVEVLSLDHFGQGVARYKNQALFIAGALPSEKVKVRVTQLTRKIAQGQLLSIIESSPKRIAPHCSHFAHCGGCSLQMLSIEDQQQLKQNNVQQIFKKFAGLDIASFEELVSGPAQAYRRRARLHFLQDRKSRQLCFGFRKRGAKDLVEIDSCPILAPTLSPLITKLRTLFVGMQARKHLGHLELYQGEQRPLVYLRLMAALSASDKQALLDFAEQNHLDIACKVADEAVVALAGELDLSYALPDFGLKLNYRPGDFIQVNEVVNQKMVSQALDWLSVKKDEKVLDLFCGIGNFSLPLAKSCESVVAIEGVESMVEQASTNAQANGLDNVRFMCLDLAVNGLPADIGPIDKVLLDPARPGALAVMPSIVKLKPSSVVYVSCDPVTLSRDSRLLLDAGYHLSKIALLDMFPDTEHIETMALFIK